MINDHFQTIAITIDNRGREAPGIGVVTEILVR